MALYHPRGVPAVQVRVSGVLPDGEIVYAAQNTTNVRWNGVKIRLDGELAEATRLAMRAKASLLRRYPDVKIRDVQRISFLKEADQS